ncbi:MAG: hypothetical protein A2521_13305 [Deltaproteobacteria bacterium RIFOXYD12_FULL_57_12]|nr:MAG: hypothetical protein A2521_13305 [Deltaproteobacteria bacterium RIFOXYD12_FULL_57_12]
MSCYRWALASGLITTPLGQFLFKHAYFMYKRHLEAGAIIHLQKLVSPGSWIIDVGANIGFFSIHFCHWVSAGGKVIALEPEPKNYSLLLNTVKKKQQGGIIEPLSMAADCSDGTARLALNPLHPGDHRLGLRGLEVTTISIDTLLAKRNWPTVSLVKIDVQGAEMRVLAGAAQTIARFSPSFFVEMDESSLAQFATSPQEIFTFFKDADYTAHTLQKQRISEPVTMASIDQLIKNKQYTDILFLPIRLRQCQPNH